MRRRVVSEGASTVSAASVRAASVKTPAMKASSVNEPSMQAPLVKEPSAKIPLVKAAAKYTNEANTIEVVGIATAIRVRIAIIVGICGAVPIGRLNVPGGFWPYRIAPRRHTLQISQLIGDGLIGR